MDRLVVAFLIIVKLAASYLIAAAVMLSVMLWPNYGGHPHIPWSSFPAILILSPWIPVDVVSSIPRNGLNLKLVIGLITFAVIFAASFWWMNGFKHRQRETAP